jgi:O-antigen/teichoic acid export membrane protein
LRKLAAVGIIGEFAVIPLLQIIMDVWLGSDTLEINNLYAVIFAIIGSINIWNSVLSTVANGVGELKPQAILFTIAVIIKIPLAWILVKIFDDWIMIVIANILSMSLYCVVQPILLSEILRKKLNYIN